MITRFAKQTGASRPYFGPMALLASLVLLSGCSGTRRPYEAWKQEVTRFVVMEGNGDPSCLRDTGDFRSRRNGRPVPLTVSSIDGPASRSSDARGILVGQTEANGRAWYVFLLAVVDFGRAHQSEIESVQPVALTVDAQGLHWYNPRDKEQTAPAYLESSRRQKQMLSTRYAAFPGPKDVFTMDARGGNVTITERNSGATWNLQLPSSLRGTKDAKLVKTASAAE